MILRLAFVSRIVAFDVHGMDRVSKYDGDIRNCTDKLVDNVVVNSLHRAFNVSPRHHKNLEDTMLGKPRHPITQLKGSARTYGCTPSGHQQQLRVAARLGRHWFTPSGDQQQLRPAARVDCHTQEQMKEQMQDTLDDRTVSGKVLRERHRDKAKLQDFIRPVTATSWIEDMLLELQVEPNDARVSDALSVWSLPALDNGAMTRREALRDACVDAEAFMVGCAVSVHVPHPAAVAALADGLVLSEKLPGASPEALADLHADVLRCVALWTDVTGRDRAWVQVKLLRSGMCTKLHVDYVDARVLCTLYGKGTEWVASPGVLHAAASFAIADGGSALGDALKDMVAKTAGPLQKAEEREVVLVRGTANPGLRPGQSRLHRSPDIDSCCGEWRLLIKVDEGSDVH